VVAALFGHRDLPTDRGSAIPTPLIDLAPEGQRQALLAQLGTLRPSSLVESFKKSGPSTTIAPNRAPTNRHRYGS